MPKIQSKDLNVWRLSTRFQKVPRPREFEQISRIIREQEKNLKHLQFWYRFVLMLPNINDYVTNIHNLYMVDKNHSHIPKIKRGEKQNKLILKSRFRLLKFSTNKVSKYAKYWFSNKICSKYLESGQLCPVRSGFLSVSHRDHQQRDIKHLDNSADPTDVYTIHHLGQGE